jgi:hypothetical protein
MRICTLILTRSGFPLPAAYLVIKQAANFLPKQRIVPVHFRPDYFFKMIIDGAEHIYPPPPRFVQYADRCFDIRQLAAGVMPQLVNMPDNVRPAVMRVGIE